MATRVAAVALGCSAGGLAAGCGDGDAPSVAAGTTPAISKATVDIASFKFLPAAVTLAAGGSVDFVNRDKAPHTAENTGEDGPAPFDTGRLSTGQHRSITFSKPGTYTYYCVYHRFMEANVIVR